MAYSDTSICNLAIRDVGANRIVNLEETNKQPEAMACRDLYSHNRDALLRSYDWPFARARVQLSEDTETPVFEFDHQFVMPSNFLRLRNYYDTDAGYEDGRRVWVIEGKRILTNETAVYLRYVKQVTDPTEFDPLFVELLRTKLALDLLTTLAGIENMGGKEDRLTRKMNEAEKRARLVAAHESNPFDEPHYIRSQFSSALLVI